MELHSYREWGIVKWEFPGGEDQGYFDNPRVAGSSPTGPKGNRSSIGRAAECALVVGSPARSNMRRVLSNPEPRDPGRS